MKLTAGEVSDLGIFLGKLNDLTKATRVSVCAYGPIDVSVGDDSYLSLAQDNNTGEYVITEKM